MTFNRTPLVLALSVCLISASCSKGPAYPDAGAAKSKSKSNTYSSDIPAGGAAPAAPRPIITTIPMGENDEPAVADIAEPAVDPLSGTTPLTPIQLAPSALTPLAFPTRRPASPADSAVEGESAEEFAGFLTRCYGDGQFYCNSNTTFLLDYLFD